MSSPRPNWKRERKLHPRRSGYEPGARLSELSRNNWCPEKCSHLRLLLFRQALELSQLSRHELVRPARVELARQRHSHLKTACLPIPPRAYGADPRICTEKQLGLSQSGLLVPIRSAKWCATSDSNTHCPGFKAGASACWATGAWLPRRDSNAQGCV